MQWLADNWGMILLVVGAVAAVAKVINKRTSHFSSFKGVRRWLLAAVDLLDLLKQTPPPK
jgi:hypothetical protein